VRDESTERGLNATEVSDNAENQMLTARPFGPGQRRSERVQKLIHPLAAFKPAGD
jgi:hypothetical protein